jgi:EamA domain-containing membrane protein RarD
MKTSTKNSIKLIFAAWFGFVFISSFFELLSPEPGADILVVTFTAIFYFLIVSALLYSVYRANKKQSLLEKEQK